MQALTFPLIATGLGLAIRCLTGEGFAFPLLFFVILVTGRRGSPLPTLGKSHHGLVV
jgi:hypothetical protein